ncbi:MAG: cytochrome b/b6 domain-containing protein [Sulfitobacter sp.]|nr:cytochrome b/b6 domain-containing protein [Sulfitobacter sp.]
MSLTNTATRYGSITKTFHWVTALLILSLIPLGWYANQLPYETDPELARKAWFFSLHKTLVAAARILWAVSQPKPGLLHADRRLESFAAETVHWLLYAALVLVPLSGWLSHAAAAGFAPIWWPLGQSLPLVPKSVSVEHAFASIHWIATKVLIAALLLHVAGALKHHLIDRDGTLRRMLPGRVTLPTLPPQRGSATPITAAVAIWAAVLVGGVVLAQGEDGLAATPAAALEEVASDWQVQEGSLGITVTQFGSEVSGQFEDWTAAITFDPDAPTREVGAVDVTVSIPSLSLGSVTQQAMGADFFDAPTFETAHYEAVLQRGVDGFETVGTLTIKERSVPLSFPFGLSIREGQAEMRADLILDRRDFAIGDNVKDEGSLAFAVRVAIRLTATRVSE